MNSENSAMVTEVANNIQKKPLGQEIDPQIIPESSQKKPMFTEQQESLYKNFMQKPFVFVPPPLFSDESMRKYRQDPQQILKPFTENYKVFDQMYALSNGQPVMQPGQSGNNPTSTVTSSRNRQIVIKIKVNNLKFLGYTLYACMIQSLKAFRDEDAMVQKLKRCNSTLNKKLEQFYKEADQFKEDYRRIQVILHLEKQIQQLEKQSDAIFKKVAQIQNFIDQSFEDQQKIDQQ